MITRTAITVVLFLSFVATASAGVSVTAQAEYPNETPRMFIADKALWKCEGTVCEADLSARRATVKSCRKVAKKIGRLSSFQSDEGALDADAIEKCNRSARPAG